MSQPNPNASNNFNQEKPDNRQKEQGQPSAPSYEWQAPPFQTIVPSSMHFEQSATGQPSNNASWPAATTSSNWPMTDLNSLPASNAPQPTGAPIAPAPTNQSQIMPSQGSQGRPAGNRKCQAPGCRRQLDADDEGYCYLHAPDYMQPSTQNSSSGTPFELDNTSTLQPAHTNFPTPVPQSFFPAPGPGTANGAWTGDPSAPAAPIPSSNAQQYTFSAINQAPNAANNATVWPSNPPASNQRPYRQIFPRPESEPPVINTQPTQQQAVASSSHPMASPSQLSRRPQSAQGVSNRPGPSGLGGNPSAPQSSQPFAFTANQQYSQMLASSLQQSHRPNTNLSAPNAVQSHAGGPSTVAGPSSSGLSNTAQASLNRPAHINHPNIMTPEQEVQMQRDEEQEGQILWHDSIDTPRTADHVLQHMYDDRIPLKVPDDNFNIITQDDIIRYAKQLFQALRGPLPAAPQGVNAEKFRKSQIITDVKCKKMLEGYRGRELASARCMAHICEAVKTQRDGVPKILVEEKFHKMTFTPDYPKQKVMIQGTTYELEREHKCTERIEKIIKAVRENRLVASDLLEGRQLHNLVLAPEGFALRKICNTKTNQSRAGLYRTGRDFKKKEQIAKNRVQQTTEEAEAREGNTTRANGKRKRQEEDEDEDEDEDEEEEEQQQRRSKRPRRAPKRLQIVTQEEEDEEDEEEEEEEEDNDDEEEDDDAEFDVDESYADDKWNIQ